MSHATPAVMAFPSVMFGFGMATASHRQQRRRMRKRRRHQAVAHMRVKAHEDRVARRVERGRHAPAQVEPLQEDADVAAGGFKTDKDTLEQRLPELSGQAREFVEAYVRYSAIRTYLSNFVDGMLNNLDNFGFIDN